MLELFINPFPLLPLVALVTALLSIFGAVAVERWIWRSRQVRKAGPASLPAALFFVVGLLAIYVVGYYFDRGSILGSVTAVAFAVYAPCALATSYYEFHRRTERTRAIRLWRYSAAMSIISQLKVMLDNRYAVAISEADLPDFDGIGLDRDFSIRVSTGDDLTLALLHFAPDDYVVEVQYPQTAAVRKGRVYAKTRTYSVAGSMNAFLGSVPGDVFRQIQEFEQLRIRAQAEASAATPLPTS